MDFSSSYFYQWFDSKIGIFLSLNLVYQGLLVVHTWENHIWILWMSAIYGSVWLIVKKKKKIILDYSMTSRSDRDRSMCFSYISNLLDLTSLPVFNVYLCISSFEYDIYLVKVSTQLDIIAMPTHCKAAVWVLIKLLHGQE